MKGVNRWAKVKETVAEEIVRQGKMSTSQGMARALRDRLEAVEAAPQAAAAGPSLFSSGGGFAEVVRAARSKSLIDGFTRKGTDKLRRLIMSAGIAKTAEGDTTAGAEGKEEEMVKDEGKGKVKGKVKGKGQGKGVRKYNSESTLGARAGAAPVRPGASKSSRDLVPDSAVSLPASARAAVARVEGVSARRTAAVDTPRAPPMADAAEKFRWNSARKREVIATIATNLAAWERDQQLARTTFRVDKAEAADWGPMGYCGGSSARKGVSGTDCKPACFLPTVSPWISGATAAVAPAWLTPRKWTTPLLAAGVSEGPKKGKRKGRWSAKYTLFLAVSSPMTSSRPLHLASP